MTTRDTDILATIPDSDPEAALRFCRALLRAWSDTTPSEKDYPEISVVMPVFNEIGNLEELYQRVLQSIAPMATSFELIFVDDGSTDGSSEKLDALSEHDSRIIVIHLTRNFGHQLALTAGLDHARGRAVIVLDSDLQDSPEVFSLFIEKWREGFEVVYAIRTNRKEHFLLRNAYSFFYRALKAIADIDIPPDSGDFCLMDRKVVNVLVQMRESNRFVRGLRSWVGFKQIGIEVERDRRFWGDAKYHLRTLVRLALDGFFSFSYLPLRLITLLGFLVSILALCLTVFYFVKRTLVGLNPPGFATTVVMICFLSGVQLVTIGVIGEYVGRIFSEVKHRPLYLVSRITRT